MLGKTLSENRLRFVSFWPFLISTLPRLFASISQDPDQPIPSVVRPHLHPITSQTPPVQKLCMSSCLCRFLFQPLGFSYRLFSLKLIGSRCLLLFCLLLLFVCYHRCHITVRTRIHPLAPPLSTLSPGVCLRKEWGFPMFRFLSISRQSLQFSRQAAGSERLRSHPPSHGLRLQHAGWQTQPNPSQPGLQPGDQPQPDGPG